MLITIASFDRPTTRQSRARHRLEAEGIDSVLINEHIRPGHEDKCLGSAHCRGVIIRE